MGNLDHAERTAGEPREPSLRTVILAQITLVNSSIRTFRLDIPPTVGSISFLPGQWLDLYVPGVDKPGGFTITSTPSQAQAPRDAAAAPLVSTRPPYLELAVQRSPENPVAHYLWRPANEILHSELKIRVGGSFVWPPPGVLPTTLRKLIFVAGGVGVNPLMSIVSHLAERPDPPYSIQFLYSMRDPGPGEDGRPDAANMLFLEPLVSIFHRASRNKDNLSLFLTRGNPPVAATVTADQVASTDDNAPLDLPLQQHRAPSGLTRIRDGSLTVAGIHVPFKRRRITATDIAELIGLDRAFTVVYVCGVPTMTDDLVQKLTSPAGVGLDRHKVLFEKWW